MAKETRTGTMARVEQNDGEELEIITVDGTPDGFKASRRAIYRFSNGVDLVLDKGETNEDNANE